jgi:4-hydroxy-3-polyprenylbenzoate decarboxylase
MTRYFLGITGASGHAYAEALLRALVSARHEVDVSLTEAGAKVMRHELAIDPGDRGERLARALESRLGRELARSVRVYASDAIESPPSSGTSPTRAVIVCPCSMGTLARVSVGFSSNLVERAADVALKEGKRLILVPRETPLSAVHLENMLKLARLGAVILPAMPGFYHKPEKLEDLVHHVVGKILDRLGVENSVGARWEGMRIAAEDDGVARRSGERESDARA